MKQLEKELEEAWDIYVDKVQNIADHYFKEFVEPFCKKRNLVFSTGMGTWGMWTQKEIYIDAADTNIDYDFDFSSLNETYYCTELIDMAYNHIFYDDYIELGDYPSKKVQEIAEILDTSVGGYNQSLGSIMPEYKP